jgi:transposase
MVSNKPRGVKRVNDRPERYRLVLRFGAPWRDLPKTFGPYTHQLQLILWMHSLALLTRPYR